MYSAALIKHDVMKQKSIQNIPKSSVINNLTVVYLCSFTNPSSFFITLSSGTIFGETLRNASHPSGYDP